MCLSLAVAVAIWAFSIQTEIFSVTVPVPVVFRIAREADLVGHPPDTVAVTFRKGGLEMLGFQLSGSPRDLEVRVNLTSLTPDSLESLLILFSDSMLSDPRHRTGMVSFQPSIVELAMDVHQDRVLPVAVVSHPVPARYMSVFLRRPHVTVNGPASVLASMDSAYTVPISSDVRIEQQVELDLPVGVNSDAGTVPVRLRNPVPVVQGVRRAY